MWGFVVILLIPYAVVFGLIAAMRSRRALLAVSGIGALALGLLYWWVTQAREGPVAEQGFQSILIMLAGAGLVAALVARILVSLLRDGPAALRWLIWLTAFASVPVIIAAMGPP